MMYKKCLSTIRILALIIALFNITHSAYASEEHAHHQYDAKSRYITLLGLMKGHLYAGKNLYQQNNLEYAKKHMKHPKDELYKELLPILQQKEKSSFTQELNQFAMKIENDAGIEAVSQSFENINATIMNMIKNEKPKPDTIIQTIINLVQTAGEEYHAATDEKRNIVNAQEYQDAWGFVTIAHQYTQLITPNQGEKIYNNAQKAQSLLESLKPAWPEIHGKQKAGLKLQKFYQIITKLEKLKADI